MPTFGSNFLMLIMTKIQGLHVIGSIKCPCSSFLLRHSKNYLAVMDKTQMNAAIRIQNTGKVVQQLLNCKCF
jgi:hypothetical protein